MEVKETYDFFFRVHINFEIAVNDFEKACPEYSPPQRFPISLKGPKMVKHLCFHYHKNFKRLVFSKFCSTFVLCGTNSYTG